MALRWTAVCLLLVAVAAMVAATQPEIPETAGAIAAIALCGAAMAGATVLARATLAPRLPKLVVAPLVVLAAFCGYGAGAQWWADGVSGTWPFFVWGLLVGPLPVAALGAWHRVRARR